METSEDEGTVGFSGSGKGNGKKALYLQLEKQYFSDAHHEEHELRSFPALLENVEVFADVGASLGQYTRIANQTLASATIFAIEADPMRFERLNELCEEWHVAGNNEIRPINIAVSDRVGSTSFYVTDSTRSGGMFPFDPPGTKPSNWKTVTIATGTLDGLFLDSGIVPDLLKMDIEGAEYRALLGATALLTLRQTRFLLEIHPWGDPTVQAKPSDVFALFHKFGYDFRNVGNHWLFVPEQLRAGRRIRSLVVGVLMDHPRLKVIPKFLVIYVRKLRARARS